MPVLVTNADTSLGTALVHRLLATGGQVRAYCSATGTIAPLRAAGAITAAGTVDDEGRLEAACEQVHTVVHLGGGLLSPSPERIVADAATVATAAANAGVQRIIVLSVVGASTSAADDLRRAKATAEDVIAECDVPSVALRVPLVLDGELLDVLAGTPLPADAREHPVRTITSAGVVELLAAFDDLRSQASSGHALFVAEGTSASALGELVDPAAGGSYRPLDTVPLLLPGLLGAWSDDAAIAADAWAFTGVDPQVPA